jgi:membrane-associated protease RseP (regulator of RpoE activity)
VSRERLWLHWVLFAATAASLFGSYALVWSGGRSLHERLVEAAMFSGGMLLVIGSHELGHFFLARRWGVDATWPYFIPTPFIGFGTLGAVIRLRGRVPNRDALVDIGAAGPLAGLFFAVPLLALGVFLSRVDASPVVEHVFPGKMSLWHAAGWAVDSLRHLVSATPPPPPLLDGDSMEFGDNLLVVGFQYLIKGPLPPGQTLYAHPVLLAGWFGCLMTMLNLMPLGQLDGGHLTHALFGKHAVTIGKAVAVFFALLALFFSWSWVVWLFITGRLIGFAHPPTVDAERPLSRSRVLVCVVCFVFAVLCFMPVPIGVL